MCGLSVPCRDAADPPVQSDSYPATHRCSRSLSHPCVVSRYRAVPHRAVPCRAVSCRGCTDPLPCPVPSSRPLQPATSARQHSARQFRFYLAVSARPRPGVDCGESSALSAPRGAGDCALFPSARSRASSAVNPLRPAPRAPYSTAIGRSPAQSQRHLHVAPASRKPVRLDPVRPSAGWSLLVL